MATPLYSMTDDAPRLIVGALVETIVVVAVPEKPLGLAVLSVPLITMTPDAEAVEIRLVPATRVLPRSMVRIGPVTPEKAIAVLSVNVELLVTVMTANWKVPTFDQLCAPPPLKTKLPMPLGDVLLTVPPVLLKMPVRLTIEVIFPATSTLPVSSVPAAIEKLTRLMVLCVAVAFNRTEPAVMVSVLIVKSRPIVFMPVPV